MTPAGTTSVRVELADRPYDVIVGRGALGELGALVPGSARQAAVITQANIGLGVDLGVRTTVIEIPDGERTKSLSTIETLCRRFAEIGLDRRDVVVGLGGGVVSDVAGMAAACWHRGTPVIQVPTTLLGQVDAAIGGKTGVNLPEGKNLVGAFWQPLGVICDPDVLASLPAAEWRSGFGEVAKYALLGVEHLEHLEHLEHPQHLEHLEHLELVEQLEHLELVQQIVACVRCKARLVGADEREAGARVILNYGHTLAHALEAVGLAGESGELRHGEAVAIGLVFAARLARSLGRIGDDRVRRHNAVVAAYDLPSRLPPAADPDRLVEVMGRDKKAHGDLTFVLDGPRGIEAVSGVDPAVVREVLGEVAADSVPEPAR